LTQNHGLSFDGISEGGSEKQGKIKPQLTIYIVYHLISLKDIGFRLHAGNLPVKDFDPTQKGRSLAGKGCKANTGEFLAHRALTM
jgi:hypothetical protein